MIDRLRVGEMTYRIERRPLYTAKTKFAKSAAMGISHPDLGRIDIHTELSDEAVLLTLAHEWLHTEFARVGAQALWKDVETNGLDIEEFLCDALAEAIVSTLRANPEFVTYLTTPCEET